MQQQKNNRVLSWPEKGKIARDMVIDKVYTSGTFSSCITVEAVLLAKEPAAMLFGGFVAENYPVVKTTLSNHCEDQQFILHDIYFDYRQWALSGVLRNPANRCSSKQSTSRRRNAKP